MNGNKRLLLNKKAAPASTNLFAWIGPQSYFIPYKLIPKGGEEENDN